MTLSNPNHATLATNGTTGTGTIENDDDEPELSIAAIVTVAEGNDAEFEVSLDESGQQVTVEYATSEGSAEEPDDYTAASGTLTFTAGDTEKTITVTTREDTLNEADETFTVTLSNPNHATLATNGTTGTGTIENDDDEPELSIAAIVTVAEGNDAEFEVSLDESGQQVTVEYATSEGSAEEPDDYTAASGTLTFTAGDTEKTITVTTREDTLNEADETFTVTLSNPNHATLATNGTTGTGTIENDDDEPELSIAAIVTVAEGNDAEFEVSLDESGQQVTVEYATSEGSAEEPDDYTAASGTLTFTAGDTEKTITVTTREDTLNEADETFTVTLSNPNHATLATNGDETFTVTLSNPNHATLATNGTTGTGTIENDDDEPELSIAAIVTVAEGNDAEFEVSLDESGQQVTVEYATSEGSAEEPDDYTAASGTLTFTAGDTEKTITVTTREDTLNEADETFTVTLSNPNHATLATNGTTGTGTIENDDGAPELSIVATVAVEEGVAAEFEVSLDESGQQVTVEYATSEGSAEEPDDYTAASGTLTFTAGDTEKTITVTTREDTLNEADETFTVTLSNPNHATLATNGTTGSGRRRGGGVRGEPGRERAAGDGGVCDLGGECGGA